MANFSQSAKKLPGNLRNVSNKVRSKESVASVKKLQKFLEETTVNKNLSHSINRTAKYDQEFDEFLEKYRAKNKGIPNIIDVSKYASDNTLLTKTPEMRKAELDLLEEFRRRRTFDPEDDTIDDEYTRLTQDDIQNFKNEKEFEEFQDSKGENIEDDDQEDTSILTKSGSNPLEQRAIRQLTKDQDFLTLILARDSTTLVTKLQRINHFRYLIFMGNGNGIIGYGKGKGLDFEEALQNAYKDAQRNLIAIPLDLFMTLPRTINTHYNGCEIYLWPRKATNAWGNPVLSLMLQLAGVNHYSFKIVARNLSPYALIYAFFKAMTQNVTPKDVAEEIGYKIYHEAYSGRKYTNHLSPFYIP